MSRIREENYLSQWPGGMAVDLIGPIAGMERCLS